MKIVLKIVLPILALLVNTEVAQPADGTDAVITGGYHIAPRSPDELMDFLAYDGRRLPIVSGHRGGPAPGLPENCLATFEATLKQTFSMLEIDPRMSRDGVVVLHHDATLERTTNGRGKLADHTWAELQQLRLKDSDGNLTPYSIPTLDEALQWARGKTILVLDQKDTPLETRIQKITQHGAESYAMLIVGRIEDIQACYRTNPKIMMEIFIGDRQKFHQFDQAQIPWRNVVAFVGHSPPEDQELLRMIHDKGARCMAGTSRYLDRQYFAQPTAGLQRLEADYRRLLEKGVDIIETDIPRELGQLLFASDFVKPTLP